MPGKTMLLPRCNDPSRLDDLKQIISGWPRLSESEKGAIFHRFVFGLALHNARQERIWVMAGAPLILGAKVGPLILGE